MAEAITFGVAGLTKEAGEADGRGKYVALGVTEGGMSGADIAVFSPSLGLQDRFSVTQTRPSMDPMGHQVLRRSILLTFCEEIFLLPSDPFPSQDLSLLSGTFQDMPGGSVGVTSFVFSRPLRACEGHQQTDLDITRC